MPTSSEIIQRRSLFAAQGTRRYKRSGCIGIGDRFTSESVIGIPRIAQLTFFDFPAEHWLHLRTTNPIESSFATVKVRTRKTKGAGSRKAGLAMAFKLVLAAEKRWRKVNAPHLVALVRAGVEFKDGEQVLHYYQVEPSILEKTPVEVAA